MSAADENTALLHNDVGRNGSSSSFIVHVSKDPADYEPFSFCAADFSCSLTLQELLPYRDDPWWQFVRRLMFASFWFVLLLTFFSACALSYVQRNNCNVAIVQGSIAATTNSNSLIFPSNLQMTP